MLSKVDWADYCYTLDLEDFYDSKQVNNQKVLMALSQGLKTNEKVKL